MISNDPTLSNAEARDAEARQAFLSGDFTRSQQLFEQELSAWRSTGRKEEIFYALHNIAEVMRYTPDYDPALARPFLEESMQVAQQIGTERYIRPAEFSLAWLDFDAGNYLDAFTKYQQIVPWFLQAGDPGGTCHVLEFIAKALIGLGRIEPGLRLYAAATAIREQRGFQNTVPAVLAKEERFLGPARGQLGETLSLAVEAEGRAFDLEQAVAYARSISLATS
jgi:tetratricopeptide (TPR) repeat protein